MTIPRDWPRRTLGERLKWLRDQRGMTVREVAALAGISQAYLSQMEVGTYANPALNVLRGLSNAFSISIDELTKGL